MKERLYDRKGKRIVLRTKAVRARERAEIRQAHRFYRTLFQFKPQPKPLG